MGNSAIPATGILENVQVECSCSRFYWGDSTQTSPYSLAWDVQACCEVVSDNQTPSVINAPSAIFTIFTRIKAKERPLI